MISRFIQLALVLGVLGISSQTFAVGINDPEEGGLGGTGHGALERPEGIERPDMPERIEPIERPDIDAGREVDIFESDGALDLMAPPDVSTDDVQGLTND